MSGFTTTATIAELINKRPINKKTRKKGVNGRFKAPQRVLKLKRSK